MLNNSTELPEAGWYVDPANAANERWWGGLEWTDTTRALRAKPAARPHPAQPVFTGSFPPPSTPVTSAGGFPSAATPASFPPAAPAASTMAFAAPTGALAIAAPVAPAGPLAIAAPAPTGGFSIGAPTVPAPSIGGPSQALALADSSIGLAGWVPAQPPPGVSELSLAAGYASTGTALDASVVSPSWYAGANKFLGPAPKNAPATAGLVLSLIGMAPISFIVSIVALAKATRIHREGFAPVGRRRAGWALAISIVVLIAAPIGISIGLPMLQSQQEQELERLAAANVPDELAVGPVVVPTGDYDRTALEQSLAVSFTQAPGDAPESITCPDAAGKAAGESITCEIMYREQPHTVVMTFDDAGAYTVTMDGVVQEQAAVPVQ